MDVKLTSTGQFEERVIRVSSVAFEESQSFVEKIDDEVWQSIEFEIPAGERMTIGFDKLFGIDEVKINIELKTRPYETGDGPADMNELLDFLETQPDVRYWEIPTQRAGARSYKISFFQNLDHQHPSSGSFSQYTILNHVSKSEPMVLHTQGYHLDENGILEITNFLGANELQVENRFHGASTTSEIPEDYEYLEPKQIAADLHRYVELFKPFYDQSWLSSGNSKSGSSAFFHRQAYPDDVAVTFTKVTSLNHDFLGAENLEFLDTLGPAECRENIRAFQRRALEKQMEVLPLLIERHHRNYYTYDLIEGRELGSLKYMVALFEWTFWRKFGVEYCEQFTNAEYMSSEDIAFYLSEVVGSWSNDSWLQPTLFPIVYERQRYLGSFDVFEHHLKDQLDFESRPSSFFFDYNVEYDPSHLLNLRTWVENEASSMAFLYGEYDPWTGSKLDISNNPDLIEKIVLEGNHNAFLSQLSEEDREDILDYIKSYLYQ